MPTNHDIRGAYYEDNLAGYSVHRTIFACTSTSACTSILVGTNGDSPHIREDGALGA